MDHPRCAVLRGGTPCGLKKKTGEALRRVRRDGLGGPGLPAVVSMTAMPHGGRSPSRCVRRESAYPARCGGLLRAAGHPTAVDAALFFYVLAVGLRRVLFFSWRSFSPGFRNAPTMRVCSPHRSVHLALPPVTYGSPDWTACAGAAAALYLPAVSLHSPAPTVGRRRAVWSPLLP